MIGALIYLIIAIVIIGVIFWAIQQLLPLVPMGEPFRTIVHVLMVLLCVIVVIWVLLQLMGMAGIGVPRIGSLHGALGTLMIG